MIGSSVQGLQRFSELELIMQFTADQYYRASLERIRQAHGLYQDGAAYSLTMYQEERRRILMIAGLTPEEYEAVGARIRIHKVRELSGGGLKSYCMADCPMQSMFGEHSTIKGVFRRLIRNRLVE